MRRCRRRECLDLYPRVVLPGRVRRLVQRPEQEHPGQDRPRRILAWPGVPRGLRDGLLPDTQWRGADGKCEFRFRYP